VTKRCVTCTEVVVASTKTASATAPVTSTVKRSGKKDVRSMTDVRETRTRNLHVCHTHTVLQQECTRARF